MRPTRPAIVLLGIGNDYRRDDGVGLVVVRHLQAKAMPHVTIIESRDGLAALASCREADLVIVVDAVSSGAEPGTIFRLSAHAEPIPAQLCQRSTHTLGVAEAIELARALHQLPRRLIVYGIEGERFEAGAGLSAAVAQAVPEIIERIAQEVAAVDLNRESPPDGHAPEGDPEAGGV
jgi:hydrogenase maturation protease